MYFRPMIYEGRYSPDQNFKTSITQPSNRDMLFLVESRRAIDGVLWMDLEPWDIIRDLNKKKKE